MSEVYPISPVLPLRLEDNVETQFAYLPQDVIVNITNRLDTMELFRFTLVCKNWRAVVYNNPEELRRVEHTIEKHVITYTRWMDRRVLNLQCWDNHKHLEFSWHLFKWCCNLLPNLETLILSGGLPHHCLEELLQSCPRLKNLIIGDRTSSENPSVPLFSRLFKLPDLEVFCNEAALFATIRLSRHVLVSSNCLKVFKAFKGILGEEDIYLIGCDKPLQNVFAGLIALDLRFDEVKVLEMLSTVNDWQLRYFGLHYSKQMCVGPTSRLRARVAFEQLLPKLKQLEIWIGSQHLLTTNRTIKLMTETKLNLSFAVFFLNDREVRVNGKEPLTVKTLIDFGNAFSSRRPDLDLSEIRFISNNHEELYFLKRADTRFTFTHFSTFERMKRCDYTLRHPKVKQHLGLDF